jgi:hypothetical protein
MHSVNLDVLYGTLTSIVELARAKTRNWLFQGAAIELWDVGTALSNRPHIGIGVMTWPIHNLTIFLELTTSPGYGYIMSPFNIAP